MTPRARVFGLTVVEQDGGLLIRDVESRQEHSLHPLTAFVFKASDGRTSIAEIASRASVALQAAVSEEQVWAAVDVLTGARLLEERLAPPAGTQRVGRRDLLRNLAVGSVAAAAVGAVTPREAGAASESSRKVGAEQDQKAHAESAGKRFAARTEEQSQKFEARVAREEATKSNAEQRGKNRDDLQSIVLDAGWANVGDPFAPATVARRGALVILGGVVGFTADPPDPDAEAALASDGVLESIRLGTLPEEARPDATLVFNAPSDGARGFTEVHITAAGDILLILEPGARNGNSPFVGPGRVSLSGVVFAVNRREPDAGGGNDEVAAERRAKARAHQEQERKSAQEQRHKRQAAEDRQKQQAAEQRQKQAAERQNKQAEEQRAKQAAEQRTKQAAEQRTKQAAEQKAKKDAAAEQQAKR